MANTTKITKAMAITGILSAIATLDTNVSFEGVTIADMTAYCENELALLAKKKAGTSKAAMERAEARNALADIVTEVLTENGDPISNQPVTSVCYALVEKGLVINTKEKKKSYFAMA